MSDPRPPSPLDRADLARALFEESGDALFLLDPEADALLDANPAAQRLTVLSLGELLRRSVADLFRPESPGGLGPLTHALRPGGAPLPEPDAFLLCTRAAGAWVPVSLAVTRLPVAPRPLALVAAHDRREQRAMLEALRASQARLEQILETTAEGIVVTDGDARIRLVNPAAAHIFGRDRAGLLGRPWGEVVEQWTYADGRPVAPEERSDERVLRRGEAEVGLTRLLVRPDGAHTLILGNSVPLLDPAGRVAGMVASFRDVTEQVRAQEELAGHHALLRAVLNSIPDLIARKDAAGVYRGGNTAFAEFLGRDAADVVGRTDADLFPPELAAALEAADRRVLAGGPPERLEVWAAARDGRRVLFETLRAPLVGPGGRPFGLIGISRDITQRRQIEEQLRQTGTLEAVGQLAGGVAHDFNNLLTAVLGHLALAQEQLPADHPARELVAGGEQAAWRAADLTRQLLGFARRHALRLEPTDPAACVAETVALLRRTIDPRIAIDVRTDPPPGPVLADAGQIGQVLLNLCLNARDAMPEGGTLTLEAADVTVDEAHAGRHVAARPGAYVRLRVADTGAGIPPEVRERIFEPFFTTKGPGQGTGLGLAVVHGIVEQHRGWVEVASEPGRGSRFDVYLPRSPRPTPPPAPAPAAAPARGTETVLLADDEPMIRTLGRAILEPRGYRVLLAADGQEAVDVFRREQGHIDLVILDLTMPRLSGRDACRELARLDPNVRVLLSSGYAADQAGALGEAGVRGFVGKPYRPADLTAAVRAALDAK
jgi:PAS domain S-box-containing protein